MRGPPVQPWKTISRRTVLDGGKFLRVESHTVELPDGQIISDWPWVITPDYVNVVALTEAGEFLCFRQTKYAVDGTSLALVGGYLEPGEDPLAAAQRELREETGYEAPDWSPLGRYAVDCNRGAGVAHFFLARQVRWVAPTIADDLEEQQLLRLSRAEVEKALMDGEFKGLPWAAALVMALFWLDREQTGKRGEE
jgi:ADP-ribose pyrophosphatase